MLDHLKATIGGFFGQPLVFGEFEWYMVDSIVGWLDNLLHHRDMVDLVGKKYGSLRNLKANGQDFPGKPVKLDTTWQWVV